MTVGIGLVCQSGKYILLAADMRASYGSVTSNDQTGKLFDLPHRFCGAVAGTISHCEDVISELYHRMEQIPASGLTSETVRNVVMESYGTISRELADQALRNDLKITLDQYFHDVNLVPSLRQSAEGLFKTLEIDADLIVAGFYKELPVQLVATGGAKIEVRPEITPGNAIIGSGMEAALNWLNYRGQNCHVGVAHSLLHLTEAKQFAEVEQTVGPFRQMVALWPGGMKALEGGQQLLQGWWNRYGLMRSDGLEADEHNEAFRTTFGVNL